MDRSRRKQRLLESRELTENFIMRRNRLTTIQRTALVASAFIFPGMPAFGAVTFSPGYLGTVVHSDQHGGAITSFDRGPDGNLYYQTDSNWTFGGFHRWDGAAQTTLVPGNSDWTGSSVVTIGDFIYYNTEDLTNPKIHRYGPFSGTNPVSTVVSTAPNVGLYTHGGELFITGAIGFGTNHIYHTSLNAEGELTADPATDLGETFGSSGPLAFDSGGNLYYAPGFGDLSIYRWSAEQVAAAIADPIANPLPTDGVLWADYSAVYNSVSGATGMTFDDEGNLAVTLTDLANPSYLVRFSVTESGDWSGDYTQLLASTERLGDLRNFDGDLYVAVGDSILQVIPEPAAWSLLLGIIAAAPLFWKRRHRAKAGRSHS